MKLCFVWNCHNQRLSDLSNALFEGKLKQLDGLVKKIERNENDFETYKKLIHHLVCETLLVMDNFLLPEIQAQQDYKPEIDLYQTINEGLLVKELILTEI